MKFKQIIIAALALFCMAESKAQLAPPVAIYFHNPYLNNPAFAGLEKGMGMDVGYKQQWSNLPGSPKTQFGTVDYALTEKVGLGLNLYNEKSGLFNQTRVTGTFAYHLPLDDSGKKLSFGVSLGLMDELIDYTLMDGDLTDVTVSNFNERDQYIDGDFGILYSSNQLQLQASLPNLGYLVRNGKDASQQVDQSRFFVSASYKFALPSLWEGSLEPKVAFREIRGYKNIVDFGARVGIVDDKLGFTALYHTTESASFGLSAQLNKTFSLLCVYTSNTAALNGQANGNFEVNLKMRLFN